MVFPQFMTALLAAPLLAAATPVLEVAQNQDPYSDWIYLYEDTFESNAGEAVTQQWWLNPDIQQRDNLLEFTLLARRNPISGNGTAAAVFSYVASCDTLSYSMEKAEFIDSNNAPIDTQTYRRVMEAATPGTEFHGVLSDVCGGVY